MSCINQGYLVPINNFQRVLRSQYCKYFQVGKWELRCAMVCMYIYKQHKMRNMNIVTRSLVCVWRLALRGASRKVTGIVVVVIISFTGLTPKPKDQRQRPKAKRNQER